MEIKYFLKNGKNIFINEKVIKNAKIESKIIFRFNKMAQLGKNFFLS